MHLHADQFCLCTCVIHSAILLLTCFICCNSPDDGEGFLQHVQYVSTEATQTCCASLLSVLHVTSSNWCWNNVRMRSLWCTEVKLWFGLRTAVARPGIVWAHEGRHCRRAPCQHALGRAVIWPPPEWALCFCVPCLCLGLSLISAPYLFSRSRVTCLRLWSPFFHTTNAL